MKSGEPEGREGRVGFTKSLLQRTKPSNLAIWLRMTGFLQNLLVILMSEGKLMINVVPLNTGSK